MHVVDATILIRTPSYGDMQVPSNRTTSPCFGFGTANRQAFTKVCNITTTSEVPLWKILCCRAMHVMHILKIVHVLRI